MTDGLSLALDQAFGALGLNRLEANIQPSNEPSSRLVFRLEGGIAEYVCSFE